MWHRKPKSETYESFVGSTSHKISRIVRFRQRLEPIREACEPVPGLLRHTAGQSQAVEIRGVENLYWRTTSLKLVSIHPRFVELFTFREI